jgi:hypothetical protein
MVLKSFFGSGPWLNRKLWFNWFTELVNTRDDTTMSLVNSIHLATPFIRMTIAVMA